MITRSTVFILGAGASVPYGYPTGEKLRSDICKNFVKRIISLGNKIPHPPGGEVKDLLEKARPFCDAFLKSSIRSIDLFLARNRHFSEIGKMAIVSSILEAENYSRFREDMADKSQDWYSYLFDKMTEDLIEPRSYKDFGGNQVTFITFNYDRSLEHFLYESFSNSFSSTPKDEIIRQLNWIKIFHVYGVIGRLGWQTGRTNYRDDYSLTSINEMKNNIKLIHERVVLDDMEMVRSMRMASRFYFLGFGYSKENLDVLGVRKYLNGDQDIYGTALGTTAQERAIISDDLRINFKADRIKSQNPIIEPVDSYKLLREWL